MQSLNADLKLCERTGRILDLPFIKSPNFDNRPDPREVSALIIHAISLPPACYGNHYVEALFTNCLDADAHPYFLDIANMRVSAHFYIKRNGETIQFVPTQYRAWHAGESSFNQRARVNDFSIGIELEGCDEQCFEEVQYANLAVLSRALRATYPDITLDNIVGHSDISPGRKTDPGPCFDWQKFHNLLD